MKQTNLAYSKKDDLAAESYHEWGTNMEDLLGEWTNVNSNTGHISRVNIVSKDNLLYLYSYGKLEEGEQDWGETHCELFSDNVSSPIIEGFIATYDLGFIEIKIVGNIKYGTMVIQSYNIFKDGSKRNNYMTREFFVKLQ